MKRPAVSIVIPAKNEEKNLAAVLSALWSSIELYGGEGEVILVDNGSSDATCSLARQQHCKVIVDPSASIARLRNLGARHARGMYLAFLDADCIVDRRWVSCCVGRLSDLSIGMVGTRAVPDLSRATWVEDGWYRLVSGAPRPDYPRWIGSSNIFLRKEVFVEVLGFNEDMETAEDVELCNKISVRYRICLEKRIDTVHLRESKTVKQMFKREVWRGKSSIRHLLASKDKKSELKSVFIPFLMALSFFCAIFGLNLHNVFMWSWIVILLLPFAMMAHKKAVCSKPREVCIVYVVSLVYLISRAVAFIDEVFVMAGLFFLRISGKYRLNASP
jgi:glycosyltransferase involved in cell wall biosynthesis